MQVGDGTSRGRDDGCGKARLHSDSERQKSRGAFVENDVKADVSPIGEFRREFIANYVPTRKVLASRIKE